LQFYPSIGGDPWSQLAYEKSVEKGWFMTYVVSQQTSIATQIYMALRDLSQYLLVITLSNVFAVDIYWVHIMFIPVLWSVFVPLIAFAIAREIGVDEKASLLAGFFAGVAPSFISWGSITVPNSLGFMSFFFSLYCFIKSISGSGRRYFILALLSIGFSFLAHFMAGVATLSLFFVYAATKVYRHHLSRISISIGLSSVAVLVMPLSIIAQSYVYPIRSFFLMDKFRQYDVYQLVLADYASMTAPELLTNGTLLFLGLVGIFLLYRKKNGSNRAFMVVSFLAFTFQYIFLFYFITESPFSPRRIWAFRDLLLLPFAATAVAGLFGFGWIRKSVNASVNAVQAVKGLHLGMYFRKTLFVLLILVALSLLVSDGVLRYYNSESYFTPGGRITIAELQAIDVIRDEYLRTNENYVAVSDHSTSIWGSGVVGAFNPNQVYLMWDNTYFNKLIQNPTESQSILSQAVDSAETYFDKSYGLVYFIASKPLIEYYTSKKYEDLVSILEGNYETFYVSPDNEIQIFVWSVPFFPHAGSGPDIQVIKDGVSTSAHTNYYYETRDNVRYYFGLNGSSEYAVTNWPSYWRFGSIRPLPSNRSIDANAWINFTASPQDTYVIEWFTNEFYIDKIIWRDDSFATGWGFYYAYGGLNVGNFSSDGNVGVETIAGLRDYYTIFRKEIPLVQNATSIVFRLKGTGNAQYAISVYEPDGKEVDFVYWNTIPFEYNQYTHTLPQALNIKYISLYVRTMDGSTAYVYWDYLALSK
jgi:hypothetical protein